MVPPVRPSNISVKPGITLEQWKGFRGSIMPLTVDVVKIGKTAVG